MSVASRNPFALLGDEDGAAPAAATPAAKKEAAAAAPKRSIPGLNNANRNGARPTTDAKTSAAARGADGDFDGPQARDGRTRGGAPGRGRGAEGRGGRGARGAGGRGGRGRQFDRHSQTGREDSAKKVEQGWGGEDPKRELDAEDGAKADAAQEEAETVNEDGTAAPKKDEAAVTANGSAEKELAPVEEEDNTKTLDEYLAEQAAKRAQIGAAKEARPAEVDPKALGTKFEKQSGDDYFAAQKERSNRQRERKEKQILEIEQSFNPPPSARGSGRGARGGERGRGGEGRGRGGEGRGRGRGGFGGERGRGGERGGRGFGGERGRGAGRGRGGSAAGGANINLADDSAFPTLG